MILTPILVPGKRKRETTKAAVEARKALKRKPGRPLELPYRHVKPDLVSETPLLKKVKKRTLKTMKSRRKMSDLERLPTELLEKVFLYCLNLDLPRSSPILAGKLSSQIVYSQIIMAGFAPTWDRWHAQEDLGLPIEQFGRPALQSDVLRCRWASLPVILKAKDAWIQKYGRDRKFTPKYFMEPTTRCSLNTGMMATEYFEADFETFKTFTTRAREGSFPKNLEWYTHHDVDRDIEIPQSLLFGPWTEEKVRYLYWLCKSGATIRWDTSIMGEVARDGLKDAIREGNIEAINILEWIGLGAELDINTLIFAIQNAGGNKFATVNQLLIGFDSMTSKEARRLRTELSCMRDEAILDEDDEKLGFVQAILDSPTLNGSLGSI